MRSRPSTEYRALKAAWRRLVEECGGPTAATQLTRPGVSSLSEYGAPHLEDRYPPIDAVLDLETFAGSPVVSRQLVRFVERAQAGTGAALGDDVSAILCMTSRGQVALGDLAACAVQAAADGDLSDRELNDLIAKAEARMHLAQRDYDALMRLRESRQGRPHRRKGKRS